MAELKLLKEASGLVESVDWLGEAERAGDAGPGGASRARGPI